MGWTAKLYFRSNSQWLRTVCPVLLLSTLSDTSCFCTDYPNRLQSYQIKYQSDSLFLWYSFDLFLVWTVKSVIWLIKRLEYIQIAHNYIEANIHINIIDKDSLVSDFLMHSVGQDDMTHKETEVVFKSFLLMFLIEIWLMWCWKTNRMLKKIAITCSNTWFCFF